MMLPSGPHVAPLGVAASRVASVTAGPPDTATFFNVPGPSLNPIHCPAGDVNKPTGRLPVYTATGERASSARTKICVPWFPTYVSFEPSGVIARSRSLYPTLTSELPEEATCRRET